MLKSLIMKKLIKSVIIITVLSTVLTSCVAKKKYIVSQDWVNKLQRDSATTHRQLDGCNTQVKDLNDENSDLQNRISAAEGNLRDVSNKSKMTIAEQAKRLKDLQDLIQSQKNVMNNLRKSIADALVNFKP